MADPFTSLPLDFSTSLSRANLVQALYTATQATQSGTKTLPGLAFLANPNVGFYLYPDNVSIGVVTKSPNGGQVEVMTITPTGVVFQIPAVGLITSKSPSNQITAPGATYALAFSQLGNAALVIVPNGPLVLTMNAQTVTAGIYQELRVLISQPTTGGFPVTINMPSVGFLKNNLGVPVPPAVNSAAGSKTPLRFTSWGDPSGIIEGAAG